MGELLSGDEWGLLAGADHAHNRMVLQAVRDGLHCWHEVRDDGAAKLGKLIVWNFSKSARVLNIPPCNAICHMLDTQQQSVEHHVCINIRCNSRV
jgi:hypothetical protein